MELRHQFDSFKREELFLKKTCAFGILGCCEKKKSGGEGSQKSCSSEKLVIRVLGNFHLGTAIKGCGGNFLAMADCLEVLSK